MKVRRKLIGIIVALILVMIILLSVITIKNQLKQRRNLSDKVIEQIDDFLLK